MRQAFILIYGDVTCFKKPSDSNSNQTDLQEKEVLDSRQINAKPIAERIKLLGYKLGYVSSHQFVCEASAILQKPLKYSLVVDSQQAVYLSIETSVLFH